MLPKLSAVEQRLLLNAIGKSGVLIRDRKLVSKHKREYTLEYRTFVKRTRIYKSVSRRRSTVPPLRAFTGRTTVAIMSQTNFLSLRANRRSIPFLTDALCGYLSFV